VILKRTLENDNKHEFVLHFAYVRGEGWKEALWLTDISGAHYPTKVATPD
jgi:hypothetical protein